MVILTHEMDEEFRIEGSPSASLVHPWHMGPAKEAPARLPVSFHDSVHPARDLGKLHWQHEGYMFHLHKLSSSPSGYCRTLLATAGGWNAWDAIAGYLSMSSIAVTGDFESEHTHRSFTDLIFQFYLQATIGRSFFFE